MLISFSVSNFRSFGEEATLNMVASNKLAAHAGHLVPIGSTGKNVLRAAVLYGANAAGKSNLVKAISAAQQLILGSRPTSVLPSIAPFRSPGLETRETSFEFRFLIGGRIFVYGFDYLFGKITSEWLSIVRSGADDIVLFERKSDGSASIITHAAAQRLFPDDAVSFKTLDKLASLQLRADQLLLNRAIELPEQAQGSTLGAVIRWLAHDLIVLPVNHRTCDIIDRLKADSSFTDFCSRFLNKVGTGVGELYVDENEREGRDYECKFLSEYSGHSSYQLFGCDSDTDIRLNPSNPNRVIVRRLWALHAARTGRFALQFSEESDGTQSLLHLLPAISSPPDRNIVVVIDELDRSLHPLICWEFIRFFSESCPGARRQLIVTTHEAHLLNQELLRRDEYWFVEKDDTQQSRLTSLSEYEIRSDLQLRKGYLNGRFGAIPLIGGMDELEKLLECRQEQVHAEENAPA